MVRAWAVKLVADVIAPVPVVVISPLVESTPFSLIVSLLIVWKLNLVGKENKSLILKTEKLHFTTDILSNGGIILGLWLVQSTKFIFWDLILSLIIAGYVLKVSYQILRRAIDELLDHSLPPVSKDEIENLIRTYHHKIVGIHNFRSRKVGEQIFLDFHIEIRGENDFKRAHGITEALISNIKKRYPGSDVTVHYDPEGAD